MSFNKERESLFSDKGRMGKLFNSRIITVRSIKGNSSSRRKVIAMQ
jgi:hypothetical protein